MSINRSVAVLVACCAALFLWAAPALACTTSTPAAQSYGDPGGDGLDPTNPFSSDLAPDVTAVTAQLDGACGLSVQAALANRPSGLIDGDAVFSYLDTDGNPATGDPVFGGADHAVGVLGEIGGDSPPLLGTWDPGSATMQFAGGPTLTPVGIGGFSAAPDQLGIAPGSNLGAVVGTIWTNIGSYIDVAPDDPSSVPLLPVNYSNVPPPPPAPATGPSGLPKTRKSGCRVPYVHGKRAAAARRKLRSSGCAVGATRHRYSSTVKHGKVLGTSPPAGVDTAKRVGLIVSRGPRHKARHSDVAVAQRLTELAARLQR
jgi:hypothetical protein